MTALRGLSWGATLLCVYFLIWGGHRVFGYQVPALAQLFAGIGTELPRSTRFVIGISNFYMRYPVGVLQILLVICKELLLRDVVIRLAITIAILLSAAWLFEFAVSSMVEPVTSILGKNQ
jgi:type II secretory pathway component PulF